MGKLARPIQFFFAGTKINLSEREKLKLFIGDIFKKERTTLRSLAIIFCTDKFLLGVNRDFLGHNYFTDIITFNLSDEPRIVEGEIYISVDRIKENAIINRVFQKEELHRVIFHGVLHLCGYKDKEPNEKRKMTLAENRCLKMYFP